MAAFDYEARPDVVEAATRVFVNAARDAIMMDIIEVSRMKTVTHTIAINIIMDAIMRASVKYNAKPTRLVFEALSKALANIERAPFPINYSPEAMERGWNGWLALWASAKYMTAGVGFAAAAIGKINAIIGELKKNGGPRVFASSTPPWAWDEKFSTYVSQSKSITIFRWSGTGDDIYLGAAIVQKSGAAQYLDDIFGTKMMDAPEITDNRTISSLVELLNETIHEYNTASAIVKSGGALDVEFGALARRGLSLSWDGTPLSYFGVPEQTPAPDVKSESGLTSDDDIVGGLGFMR